LFVAGAAMRQPLNMRQQSGVVDLARHKRIIETGDRDKLAGADSSQ
jgi:hypothetical protein